MATGRPSSDLLDQGLDFATRNIKADRLGDLSVTASQQGAEVAFGTRLSRTRDLTLAAYYGRRWRGGQDYGARLRWSFGR